MKKVIFLLSIIMFFFKTSATANYEKKFYDLSIERITGEKINFKNYKKKFILVDGILIFSNKKLLELIDKKIYIECKKEKRVKGKRKRVKFFS